MRTFVAMLALAAVPAAHVALAAEVPGDTVVATLNGRKFTADQVRSLVTGAPQQVKDAFERDPKQFLRDHAYYLLLVGYAEQNGLDKQAPYRDMLEFYRLTVLTSAAITHKLKTIPVSAEEQRNYYETHQPEFREVKVRMIYVPFSDALAEEESKNKAAAFVKRARAGEDFAKLAAEASPDNSTSGAEFTVRSNSSQPPEHMRKVLLNLSDGDITDPLRHDNGYYVFRVESSSVQPYEKVRDEIYRIIQSARFNEWQQKSRAGISVQFDNEEFFKNIAK